jgi:hypothetical protein
MRARHSTNTSRDRDASIEGRLQGVAWTDLVLFASLPPESSIFCVFSRSRIGAVSSRPARARASERRHAGGDVGMAQAQAAISLIDGHLRAGLPVLRSLECRRGSFPRPETIRRMTNIGWWNAVRLKTARHAIRGLWHRPRIRSVDAIDLGRTPRSRTASKGSDRRQRSRRWRVLRPMAALRSSLLRRAAGALISPHEVATFVDRLESVARVQRVSVGRAQQPALDAA